MAKSRNTVPIARRQNGALRHTLRRHGRWRSMVVSISLQQRLDGGRAIEHLAAFEVRLEAAVVHIDRSLQRPSRGQSRTVFPWTRPGVKVYILTSCARLVEVALRHQIGKLVVGMPGMMRRTSHRFPRPDTAP